MQPQDMSLFELRRFASLDIQSIAQTCTTLNKRDKATYLNYLVIGIHGLRDKEDLDSLKPRK